MKKSMSTVILYERRVCNRHVWFRGDGMASSTIFYKRLITLMLILLSYRCLASNRCDAVTADIVNETNHVTVSTEVATEKSDDVSSPTDIRRDHMAKNRQSQNDQTSGLGIIQNLLSGLVGALIAVVLQALLGMLRRSRERYSLLRAVSNECKFNLSILDEIANGISNGITGSYKRVKNDFFTELRKVSFRYHLPDEMYSIMANVACDEDLLIRELDELQNDMPASRRLRLGGTALVAVKGVRGSLISLRNEVDRLSNDCLVRHLYCK